MSGERHGETINKWQHQIMKLEKENADGRFSAILVWDSFTFMPQDTNNLKYDDTL